MRASCTCTTLLLLVMMAETRGMETDKRDVRVRMLKTAPGLSDS